MAEKWLSAEIRLSGNLGRDAEKRYSAAGKAYTKFNVAVKPAKDHTDWYSVTCFDELAEQASPLTKGTKVEVRGRLVHREYETSDGSKRISNDVIADEVTFDGMTREDDPPSRGPQGADLDSIPF